MRRFRMTKSDIGVSKWPFVIDEVIIEKDKKTPALYVKIVGRRYNLNGVAKSGAPLEEIWLDNPQIPGTKKPINFIFRLCEKNGLLN